MDDEVVIFCQTQIIDSGLVLDEDLVFIQMVERNVKKPVSSLTRKIIFLATAACSTLWTIKNGGNRVRVWSTGILFIIPAATTFLLSYYRRKKADSQKEMIIQLLSEFRSLSRTHSEVTDFLKCFSFSMDSSNNPYTRISEETIFDLSKSSCDLQVQITNEMQKVISQIHVGLHDVSLDLTEFQKATGVSLVHDSVLGCLRNCSFVEGQVVLLRSHLLTSLFLVSSSKGNQEVFLKILDKVLPPLVDILKQSIVEIRIILNKTRFPTNLPSLSLAKIENIFAQKKIVCVPRMKKHVIKINDGICCTFMKLRVLLETLENVESESQMLFLQEAVSTLTHELHRCYMSAADLEKLIELLNRNPRHTESIINVVELVPKENIDNNERIASESEEPVDDSDYQVFTTGICDDDNEGHAVRFYKRFMKNDVDWLAELKQSDEFQRRQTKFHTGLPLTSTPLDPSVHNKEDASFKSSISLQDPYSLTQLMSPPPPPPMPSAFPTDLSDIMSVPSTLNEKSEYLSPRGDVSPVPKFKVEPVEPLTTVESSLLLDSLKGVLNKMGPREEDEFE